MPTRFPSEIETTDRSEMICPECFHEGLEANPGYADDYSGKAELIRATRCPNEDCENYYGVPEDDVREQYGSSGMSVGMSLPTPQNLDTQDILLAGLVIAGLFVISSMFLGGGGPPQSPQPGDGGQTINGQVLAPGGSPLTNATVYISGETNRTPSRTNTSGLYRVQNLSPGAYMLYVMPQNDSLAATPYITVNVTQSGNLSVASGPATVVNNSLRVTVPAAKTLSTGKATGNASVRLNYSNAANAQKGVTVRLSPLDGDETQESVVLPTDGDARTLWIPGTVTDQSVSVETDVTTTDKFNARRYRGQPQTVTIGGNLPPELLALNVSLDAGLPQRTIERQVSDGDTLNLTVEGDGTYGSATVAIYGGTDTADETKQGTWSGSDPTVRVGNDSAPSTLTVELSGDIQTEERQDNGTIENSLITYNIAGNLRAERTTVTFTGGVPKNTTVGMGAMSNSGVNGTVVESKYLYTADSDGRYRVETDLDITRNASLVAGGYMVNGEKVNVSTGQSETYLNLSDGDAVSVWLRTERNMIGEKDDYSDSSAVRVRETTVSSQDINTGGRVDIAATAYNPASSTESKTLVLFRDGKKVASRSISLGPGEEKTISMGSVSFDTAGTHSVSVSESDRVPIEVGDVEPVYGEGSLNGKLIRIGGAGTVKVDTDGDGSKDCTVSSDGGQCVIGRSPTGPNALTVSQEGVTDVSYSISYVARWGARGITVDVGANGTTDLKRSGELRDNETLSGTVQIPAGQTTVDIETDNGGTVDYTLKWTKAQVVSDPKVYMDGAPVIENVGSFKGKKTFDIGELDGGPHTFRFETSGGMFTARIEWTEQGDNQHPTAYIGETRVCGPEEFAGNGRCKIENPQTISPGKHLLEFRGGSNEFSYGITHTARATPTGLRLAVNDDATVFRRVSADTVNSDGSWATEDQIGLLSQGSNTVQVSPVDATSMPVSGTVTLNYKFSVTEPRQPSVTVIAPNGTRHSKTVPQDALSSQGVLATETSLTLPAKWFGTGTNRILVGSQNRGIMQVNVTATTGTDQTLTLKAQK